MADSSHFNHQPPVDMRLARLNAKLWALKTASEAQESAVQSLSQQIGALHSAVERQDAVQQKIEAALIQHGEQIGRNASAIAAILNSRIWRTLAALGTIVLPLVRRAPQLQDARTEPVPAPNSHLDERPAQQVPGETFHKAGPELENREKTVDDWKRMLGSATQGLSTTPGVPPSISIITPTFNSKPAWFAQAALSVFEQTFRDWEWCIVDDASEKVEFYELFSQLEANPRVRVFRRSQRGGISAALNHGLQMARGRFVCFLDHDDTLEPDALERCCAVLSGPFDAVYTDEDKITEAGVRHTPLPKPDWSPEFFRWVMFVGHLLCVRRDLAIEIGGFKSEYDRVQDYEFMLRYSERTQRIFHVSRTLYHWRAVDGSVAADQDAKGDLAPLQIAAVQAHLDRLRLPAKALAGPRTHMLKLIPSARTAAPRVSLVIATAGSLDELVGSITSLYGDTDYPDFEVICVASGISSKLAGELTRDFPIRVVCYQGPYNRAAANNLGARQAGGRFIVFLDKAVRILEPDWIAQMLYYAEQRDIGCVGGLLLRPDRMVKQAGLMISCDESSGDKGWRPATGEPDGYWGSLLCAHEVTAISDSCAMFERTVFEASGGFDTAFATHSADLDLCLRVQSQKKRIIFAPGAVFLDRDSAPIGAHALEDRVLLFDRWADVLEAGDPYYKRNASQSTHHAVAVRSSQK